MKFTIVSTTLLAYALTMVSAAALPDSETTSTTAPASPDGYYSSSLDAEGNEIVHFIPWNELGNSSFVPIRTVITAAELAKREDEAEAGHELLQKRAKQGCHKSSVTRPVSAINKANDCLINGQTDPITFEGGGNQRRSCVKDGVRSFICSYGGTKGEPTIKWKGDLRWTWEYIQLKVCVGTGRLGHAEIPHGYGLVSAGYTYDGDKYCW